MLRVMYGVIDIVICTRSWRRVTIPMIFWIFINQPLWFNTGSTSCLCSDCYLIYSPWQNHPIIDRHLHWPRCYVWNTDDPDRNKSHHAWLVSHAPARSFQSHGFPDHVTSHAASILYVFSHCTAAIYEIVHSKCSVNQIIRYRRCLFSFKKNNFSSIEAGNCVNFSSIEAGNCVSNSSFNWRKIETSYSAGWGLH